MLNLRLYIRQNLCPQEAFTVVERGNVEGVTKSVIIPMKEAYTEFLERKIREGFTKKKKIPELSHEVGVGVCRVVWGQEVLPGRGAAWAEAA